MRKILYIIAISFLYFGCKKEIENYNLKVPKEQVSTTKTKFQIFERISSTHSKITFNNLITENLTTKENLFDFDYFYNGAGVGIEDINNDGLKDIFFTGNQVENKLYLNKGNLVFEDISKSAGININKSWSNGVTFADVNNDGWMDIYVTQGGPKEKNNRKNLLFINQKNLTFKESAEIYGLADTGISTQAAFFDYDKDGDLDCIVSNENELYGIDPITFHKILSRNKDLLKNSSAHFYENRNNYFINITKKAGLLKPAFGLGLTVSDINNDGWLDIYITNDYYIPDAMYINNKDGTFTDQIKTATKQISFYGMGVDIADINNDGLQDIYVLDMASNDHFRAKTLMASMNIPKFNLLVDQLKFQNQYMYNSLQLNIGNNQFNNIAQLSKLSKTDWSWAGLIVDLNNNENKDIFVTNGYRRYALDNDLQNKVIATKKRYRGNVPLEIKKELYYQMPSEKLSNIIFSNKKDLQFEDEASNWGLNDPSFSNGASYGDLDNDGDLELVINNIDDKAFLYKNLTIEQDLGNYLRVSTKGNTSESFAKVSIKYNNKKQLIESKRVKGYLSSTENSAHFGLGTVKNIDTVRVEWLNGKYEEKYNVKVNSTITFNIKEANSIIKKDNFIRYFKNVTSNELNIIYNHKENYFNDFTKEVLLPYKQSTLGPNLAIADVNGDSRDDIFIGGASGQSGKIFIQTNVGFKEIINKTFDIDKLSEDLEAIFFDIDNDGDNDLYVVSGGNEFAPFSKNYIDRLYINDGKGVFKKSNTNDFEDEKFSGKTVTTIDYDKDGDLDLIVGNRMIPQNYPKPSVSIIYKNEKGKFTPVTEEIAPDFMSFGIVNKVIKTDFNNDGWEDFIAVGDWTHIGLFKNNKGVFEDVSEKSGLNNEKGWWFSISETDVNNDGFKDYIVGNIGLNIKFKASKEKPLKIFANDFDTNGTLDVVLSSKYRGEYVPVRGKECSTQQMPFISKKYKTYEEFANASLIDIYGDKLDSSYQNEANEFHSILLLNNQDGTFTKKILPILAQSIPILDAIFYDINKDGFEDAIIGGNIYNTEVETPRLDNISGLVLLSNKKDNYDILDRHKSGLYISGNVKSLKLISHKNKNYIIAAKNNDNLSFIEILE